MLDSPDEVRQLSAAKGLRKLLSLSNSTIDYADLLPRLVLLLTKSKNQALLLEVVGVLAHVAETTWHTQDLVHHGAVPALVALLTSSISTTDVQAQSVRALGILADDGARNQVIKAGGIEAVGATVMSDGSSSSITLARRVARALRNLCSPSPSHSKVLPLTIGTDHHTHCASMRS
jgi:hypothetical protein